MTTTYTIMTMCTSKNNDSQDDDKRKEKNPEKIRGKSGKNPDFQRAKKTNPDFVKKSNIYRK